MRTLASGDVTVVATDVGLWMALPAFGPAFVVVGVVFYVIHRDRRANREDPDAVEELPARKNEVK